MDEIAWNSGFPSREARTGRVTLLLVLWVIAGGLSMASATAEEEPGTDQGDLRPIVGTPLTLEQSIAIALEKNFGIRQERRSHQMAREDLQLATAERFHPRAWAQLLLPAFGQRTVQDFDPESATDQFIRSESTLYDGNLNLAYPIFSGGEFQFQYSAFRLDQTTGADDLRTWSSTARLSFLQPFLGDNPNRLAQTRARYAMDIAEEALRRQVVTLTNEVANAYYGLVKELRGVEIGRHRLRQSQSGYDIARSKFQAGLIPEVEAMQLEVELARSRADLERDRLALRQAEDWFRQVLGLPLDQEVQVVTDVPEVVEEIALAQAVEEALRVRSDIRERSLQIELARLDLRSARRQNNVSGNLRLYYEYDGKDRTFSDALDNRQDNHGVTFGLSVPLFDAGRNKAQVTRRRLSLESLELALEELRRSVELEVRDAAWAVGEARTRLEILEASLRVAERTYEINLQRFEVGTLTSQELFLEEVRLNEARTGHLDALIDLNLAWARFLRVVNQ